ncbi:MAG: hypothetical protein M0Z79_03610 [Nitrospiraceae bacterium]|nr:hypothetical protein [Nitrospiraceae bacterium]
MPAGDRGFSIRRQDQTLIFRTAYFSAERGSVLHSGIYNREMASILVSFAAAGLIYMVLARSYGTTPALSAVFLAVFAAGFLLLRRFVFRERSLEAVFDAAGRTVTVRLHGTMKGRPEVIPFGKIERLLIQKKEFGIVNPDGVAFVEKISAQHGTVIPGFGQEKVFYVVELVLSDGGPHTLFAGSHVEDALAAYDEIRGFSGLP